MGLNQVSRRPYKPFKGDGGVRNLFDRLYYYSEGFPEPGRTDFVPLNASLQQCNLDGKVVF